MIRSLIVTARSPCSSARPSRRRPAARADRRCRRCGQRVTVTCDVVRIGDLVENAGPVADVPIFRAPDLGTTGAVATDSIVDAIRPHQLIGIDTRGLAEVIVTPASRTITRAGNLRRASRTRWPDNTASTTPTISWSSSTAKSARCRSSRTRPATCRCCRSVYDPRTTRFDVTFDLPTSAALHRQSTRFTGTAIETVDAVAVDHPVERGELLKASDLTVLRRPKSEVTRLTDRRPPSALPPATPCGPDQPLQRRRSDEALHRAAQRLRHHRLSRCRA